MIKTRYEVDPDNRLVIVGTDRKTSLPLYRKVVDGRFKISPDNSLSYLVRSPQALPSGVPNIVKLRGDWTLTKNHDLKLSLEKSNDIASRGELVLSGSIIDAKKSSLLFAVTTKSSDGTKTSYGLEFAGSWQADSANRLTFRAKRESGKFGILTFNGAWEMGENNSIIYKYTKRVGVRKTSKVHQIAFKGRWDITGRKAITYTLDASTNSAFNFRTGMAIFKRDRIEYELGVGYTNKLRPKMRTVVIYGRWTIRNGSGISFEVETSGGIVYAVRFNAEARLTDRDAIAFKLMSGHNMSDLDADIEIKRKLLTGDGETFIRFMRSREEKTFFVGAATRW